MADQDFGIKVTTTADLAAIEETKASIAALETRIASLKAQIAAESRVAGFPLAPIPPPLNEPPNIGDMKLGYEGIAKHAKEVESATLLTGMNLTRARQEALVLVRELETGGNVTRTLGSLLGSLGTPVTIAAVAGLAFYEHFKNAAEEVKRTALEQVKLNAELEKELKTLGQIKDISGYEKLRDATRERLDQLQKEREIETDPKKLSVINERIAAAQEELARAPALAAKALERAQHEEQIKFEMQEQVHELELQDAATERARATAAKRVQTENQITNIRLEGKLAGIDESLDRGEISAIDAVVQKAKAKRDALQENFDREQANGKASISSIEQQVAAADVAEAAEEAQLQAIEKRKQADVEASGNVDKAVAAYTRLSKTAKDADDAATKAEDARDEVNRRDESTFKDRADAEAGAVAARQKTNDALRDEQKGASDLAAARAEEKTASQDIKTVQDELITQAGILKEKQDALNKARKEQAGIPKAKEDLGDAQIKFDAAKKAADEQEARDKAATEKRQQDVLSVLHIEDEIQKAKDSGDVKHEKQLQIELAYAKELLALKRAELSPEQAAAEAGVHKQEAEIAERARQLSQTPQQRQAEQAASQEASFRQYQAALQVKDEADRRARGAYPTAGTPDKTGAEAAESMKESFDRQEREGREAFTKAFEKPSIDEGQLAATKEFEKTLAEAKAPQIPKPEELKPEQRGEVADKLSPAGDKLSTAADKLSAAADKLVATRPSEKATPSPAPSSSSTTGPGPLSTPLAIPPISTEEPVPTPLPTVASSEEDSGIPDDPFSKLFGGGLPTPTPTPSPTPKAPTIVAAPTSAKPIQRSGAEMEAEIATKRETDFNQFFHPDWQNPPPSQQVAQTVPQQQAAKEGGIDPATINRLISVLSRLEESFA